MPLKRDRLGGGSEADGSRSAKFCSHCYRDGKFVLPDLTADEMKLRVKAKLREVGIPGFLTGLFTRSIPKLERWKRP